MNKKNDLMKMLIFINKNNSLKTKSKLDMGTKM